MVTPDDLTQPATPDPAALDATTYAANKAADALGSLSKVANGAKGVFGMFQGQVESLKISFQQNQSLTQDQTAAFGLLATSVLGARKAFDNLNGVDTSGLDTISKQWKDLSEIIDKSPINQAQKDFRITDALKNFGANSKEFQAATQAGGAALTRFAAAFFESADNGLRLQNAMVQLAAKTGNLNEIFRAAGPNLNNMNALLANQQKSLTDTAMATGLSADQVENYYAQLGQIPKALSANVEGSNTAGKSINMLTATIQYAKGAGRSFQDVMTDLKTAFHDYNLTGEEALKFTARMGELSNKFGIELTDVQGALRDTAGMFKMFGNEAEGAANLMNSYLGALEKTGISGHAAIEVMNGMTSGIKNMGLAQKAFLSSQTGGPGGLMGAFQIEKMLRDGKIDEVFDKVRQQMGKQFGKIVTLDDAQNSPQAAAQMTKQMMILKQGPLGSFAKDDQSAMRILEAFKTRDQGGAIGDLSKSIVQDTMKTGVNLQEKSVTELTKIRELIQASQGFSNAVNLGTVQQGMTAGVGTPMQGIDYNADMRDNLKRSSHDASIRGGTTTTLNNMDVAKGMVKDRSGNFAAEVGQQYQEFYKEIGPALKGPINKLKELFQSGKADEAGQTYKSYLQDIEKRKEELKSAPAMTRGAGMQQIQSDEDDMRFAYQTLSAIGGKPSGAPRKLDLDVDLSKIGITSQDALRNAATQSSNRSANGTHTGTAAGAPGQTGGQQIIGQLTVTHEGYCLNCGEKMKKQEQMASVSVGSGVPI